jgi:hypothetical protein
MYSTSAAHDKDQVRLDKALIRESINGWRQPNSLVESPVMMVSILTQGALSYNKARAKPRPFVRPRG